MTTGSEVDRAQVGCDPSVLHSLQLVRSIQDVVLLGTRVERREFPADCATVQARSSWKGLRLVVRERRKGEMGVPREAGSLGLEKT